LIGFSEDDSREIAEGVITPAGSRNRWSVFPHKILLAFLGSLCAESSLSAESNSLSCGSVLMKELKSRTPNTFRTEGIKL
jgi:hypothetical protein